MVIKVIDANGELDEDEDETVGNKQQQQQQPPPPTSNNNYNNSTTCDSFNLNAAAVVPLDLNDGLDLNTLNDGLIKDVSCGDEEEDVKKTGVCIIDLNVMGRGCCHFEERTMMQHKTTTELEEEEVPAKQEHHFDLNLGLVDDEEEEEVKNAAAAADDGVGELELELELKKKKMKENEDDEIFNLLVSKDTQKEEEEKEEEIIVGVERTSTSTITSRATPHPKEAAKLKVEEEEEEEEEVGGAFTPSVDYPSQGGHSAEASKERKAKRRKKLSDCANSSVAAAAADTIMTLRRSRRRPPPPPRLEAVDDSSAFIIMENVQSESNGLCGGVVDNEDDFIYSEGEEEEVVPLNGSKLRGRNRRKTMELPISTQKVLRRTSRRLAAAALSADNNEEAQSSSAAAADTKNSSNAFPLKLKLPPSSEILDLDGVPILDLFSVYACLRSFSTLLFLSPFSLEDFVDSLRCNTSNRLFDSIHVSLLQTLRKHLELLSGENILSASICLRNLDWDLLDSITWPIFMVNYLLTHGSALKAGFDLPKLKLFESEYYKQAVVVKIEILCCLCNDVIEADAIRSEINRRTLLATESNMHIDRVLKTETYKKRRRTSLDVVSCGTSCLTTEEEATTTDWNSDECCLCKMDGSLICCDGCPAAYHLKCVGVVNNLLPDGDWYCPECVIDKDTPWLKMGKSLRGAEILGSDPDGRLYFSSAGYLLVSDSCDSDSSYRYYHINDLTTVVDALRLSGSLYKPILCAISNQFNIFDNRNGTKTYMDVNNPAVCLEIMKEQICETCVLPLHVPTSELYVLDETIVDKKPEKNYIAPKSSGSLELEALVQSMKTGNLLTSPEGSVKTSQALIQGLQTAGSYSYKESFAISNDFKMQDTTLPVRDVSSAPANLYGNLGKNAHQAECVHVSPMMKIRHCEVLQKPSGIGYMNYYSFAHTASLLAEELTRKSSDKVDDNSIKSVEDIIAAQLKTILKKSSNFYWPIYQNPGDDPRKEKCGWCFACRAPDRDDDNRDCFFNLINVSNPHGFGDAFAGLYSRQSKADHLVDIIYYLLCLEDRLHGLLVGPWLNPHYSNLWHKSVRKASDVNSLKYFLLMLEANLHRLAFTPEWIKHVDSANTIGSASHIVTSSSRIVSKHAIGRKRARYSDIEPKPSSYASSGLGLLWWRGGKLSRQLFHWKNLPRALASKAARQAGCTKIPGLLYLDNSDITKRSRSIVWKAAVEGSRSLEQLAFQVRELDANIKWDDIENTDILSKTYQYRKSFRSFKKVIVRQKRTEGTVVKYLLDFGKRRFVPDIVVTHGRIVEEPMSGRKKYWLEDTYVPLHLIKAFEEKRLARKSNKINPGKLHCSDILTKRISKGFHYLFAKSERSEYFQCGQCDKDVLIREAVGCVYCNGFFHKRHVKKYSAAIAGQCTYSCNKCQRGKFVKHETKKANKTVSRKSKNSSVRSRVLRSETKGKVYKIAKPAQMKKKNKIVALPLRRSPRKLKCVALQHKKVGNRKKGKAREKKIEPARKVSKKPKESVWQKKRTHAYHSYWLNGILLSRKPNDERVVLFKRENLVVPSEAPLESFVSQPKCSVFCKQEFMPFLNYVRCEICRDWFHGDAFGLTMARMNSIIGFRCHNCRDRASPNCPQLQKKANDETKAVELNTCVVNEDLESSFAGEFSHGNEDHIAIAESRSNVENGKLPRSEL